MVAIKLRPGPNHGVANFAAAIGFAKTQGGQQRQTLRQLNTITMQMPAVTAQAFIARMRGRADVAGVELMPRRSLSLIPNDTQYAATASYLNAVTAPAAWDVHKGSPGVLIAVVDTGVDVNHPDLIGRVAGTYDAATGGTDVTDAVGHGTFVAGVAAATANNGIGIAGASMGASVLAVKVADVNGQIPSDNVVAGILWAADNGAKVINLSLGGNTASVTERDAVAYAVGKGVLVVASAGNDANSTLNYPAAYPQVVAVGATDAAGHRATFSNFGGWVTVAAPGVGITGTAPTAGSEYFKPGYDKGDGTSFSSPIVAAEAALLWSLRPSVSATDVRLAIVRSSHGYANLGLGTGQVDFRAADSALRPDSFPTLTLPVNGAKVAGVVGLTANSAAAKVRFLINGTAVGAPVATVAGVAAASWTSWGAANGSRTVTAVDCSIKDLCNVKTSGVTVSLTNLAAKLTSPAASRTLTGAATFTATAPGGGVAFNIDGVRRGFDSSTPYSMVYSMSSLVDGAHKVQVLSCSTTGTTCAGPASAVVSFISKALHPKITAVSPSVVSPNADGRKDTTKATYVLPDTEYVRFQVRNAAGTIVYGPNNLGSLGAGTRSVIWNGMLNSKARAANGTYSLELSTSRGDVWGWAVAKVLVDSTAPSMTSIIGSGTTFFPYVDAYKDTFAPKFTLNERATVTVSVRTSAGALVRSISGDLATGANTLSWNGKNTAGAQVAAGTYFWILTAQDPAGNRRTSSKYSVVVNARHLVTKTVTLTRRGAAYFGTRGTDVSCTLASKAKSYFTPNGLWLFNNCDYLLYGAQFAEATYRFTVPAATIYTSLRVDTLGDSSYAPSTLGVAFTQWATGSFTSLREMTVQDTNVRRAFGSVAPAGLIDGSRQVETTLYVPNDYEGSNDYDASDVRLVVTYKVLA